VVSNPLNYAADPRLTTIGEEQARSAHTAWEREILRGVPIPQKFYCSPLTRAIRTLELTFEGILPAHLKPLIVEVISCVVLLRAGQQLSV
jgi:broad specificity phosphatase PhoE